jgi:4-hydroxybutyrate CoA-transferase
MSDWLTHFQQRRCTADIAVQAIISGNRVFLSGNASVPQVVLRALVDHAPNLHNVKLVHVLTVGPANYVKPELQGHVRLNSLFIAHNVREAVQSGHADFTPVYLGEIPGLLRTSLRPDVSLLQVSPPDDDGYCSLGTEVGVTRSPADAAIKVIAEINPHMPRTFGESRIHITRFDHIVEVDYPLPELPMGKSSPEQKEIARHIANLIDDGSTLQVGIGGLPDALLPYLSDKRRLGLHSELFSDGVVDLVEKGVITGEAKTLHTGKVIAGFVIGSKRLYDFVNQNPLVELYPTDYTNDPAIIAKHDNMVSINAALEVDLSGQVCADSIGHQLFSGVGGQLEFTRGTARAKSGKPIIALPSTAKQGTVSRIVWELKPGAGIATPRNDVHYVVTEYGTAYLYGKTIAQRVRALINIAAPQFREELEAQARAANYLPAIYNGADLN